MADQSNPLILDGLSQAMADPGGQPLHSTRGLPGLFASTAAAKQAARACLEAGYLRVIRSETRGKNTIDICAITDAGVAYLLEHANPRSIVEKLLSTLEARGRQLDQLIDAAQQCRASLEAMQAQAGKVLSQLKPLPSRPPAPAPSVNGSVPGSDQVVSLLRQWQAARPNEDCSLPELYQRLRQSNSHLTLGQFHDLLRQLHEKRQVYLYPWTGPMHEIPEPSCALLIGHTVAYYASVRASEES